MYSNPRILTTKFPQSQKSDYLERILALLQEAQIDIQQITPNSHHHQIFSFKPWEDIPATFSIKKFTKNKKSADHQLLCKKHIKNIEEMNKNKEIITYTDGSVDLNNNRAVAAAVIRNKNNQIMKIFKQRILIRSCLFIASRTMCNCP